MLPKQIPKTPPEWRVSSYSDNGGDCVEVAIADIVGVRDTKNRDGGQLDVAPAAWLAAVARLRQA